MKHTLMKLPYSYDALEPIMSKETLEYHYGKHHKTYVDKLNSLIIGTEFEEKNLIEIIRKSDGAIFNNAAQVFNHDFFFKSLSPEKYMPSAELEEMIEKEFGSLDDFKKKFNEIALGLFGSGWVWLAVDKKGNLSIVPKSNAGTVLTDEGLTPLLACDVWEHAYYIDRRNNRAEYLKNFWNIVNWKFVSENLSNSLTEGAPYAIGDCNVDTDICDYVEDIIGEERVAS